jgi:uncharacterized membrane protein YqjE
MTDSAPRGGLASSLRSLVGSTLGLLRTRLDLLSVELQEEKLRLFSMFIYGAVAIMLLSVGVVFLAVFVTVLLWDSHRLLALGIFSAIFLLGGTIALVMLAMLTRTRSKLFAASLAELAEDSAALQSEARPQ